MTNYEEYIARKTAEYGAEFDQDDLNPEFIPYFRGERIEVRFKGDGYDFTERGRVSVTTGRKPIFLLLKRRNSISSSTTLGKSASVVRVVAA